MRYLPAIAGVLLGALFALASISYFAGAQGPAPAPGSAAEHFFLATGPTGFLTFVKVLELAGAVLVAIPATRRLGLLILGPIALNIVAFHLLIARDGILDVMHLAVLVLPLYLVWAERRAFLAFLRGTPPASSHVPPSLHT